MSINATFPSSPVFGTPAPFFESATVVFSVEVTLVFSSVVCLSVVTFSVVCSLDVGYSVEGSFVVGSFVVVSFVAGTFPFFTTTFAAGDA